MERSSRGFRARAKFLLQETQLGFLRCRKRRKCVEQGRIGDLEPSRARSRCGFFPVRREVAGRPLPSVRRRRGLLLRHSGSQGTKITLEGDRSRHDTTSPREIPLKAQEPPLDHSSSPNHREWGARARVTCIGGDMGDAEKAEQAEQPVVRKKDKYRCAPALLSRLPFWKRLRNAGRWRRSRGHFSLHPTNRIHIVPKIPHLRCFSCSSRDRRAAKTQLGLAALLPTPAGARCDIPLAAD